MVRFVQILSVSLLLTLASVAKGQTSPACGIVDIDGPSEVEPNKPIVFKAKTTMIHTTKPEFKWTLSAGTITMGEGTDEITVDTAGLGGQELTATAELSGAPSHCKRSASKTTRIGLPNIIGCRFDSYGDIKFEDETARLDNFAIQLSNEPLSSGYLLMFAGQETYENETEERLARAKSYLSNVRDIDPNRIVGVDCGFATQLTIKLWIVPVGASPPECIEGGLEFREVKFTKPRPKPWKEPR